MNGYIWKAQPRWMKVVEAVLVFAPVVIMEYTLIFDQDDPKHHMLVAIAIFIIVGLVQIGFYLRASSRGDL